MKTLTLKNNLPIPVLGFGTWKLKGQSCADAVSTALKLGYLHIDTADVYGNHKEVALGIKNSGVKRENFFLTTKVWRDQLHHDDVLKSAERFLKELQTDYIDLLLVHWPNTTIAIKETLTALKELQNKKIIKAFGLSNFTIPLLEEALATKIEFVNNQVEFHPSLNQKELKEFCDANKIVMTAYSPIAQGADLKIPQIQELAKKYQKTPAQIVLNWILRKNIVVIPRSSNPERIKENLEALSFQMTDEDSAPIDNLTLHTRIVRPDFAPFKD
jgi:diketogulonate reductase-like aldo/keto reductase